MKKEKNYNPENQEIEQLDPCEKAEEPSENEVEAEKALKRTKKKVRRRNMLIVILVIIIILLLLRSCGHSAPVPDFRSIFNLTEDEAVKAGNFETRNPEDVQNELNKVVDEGMMNISMNLKPTFASGTSKGNLMIMNESINRYPQIVEIYKNDDDSLIYQSGLIPVGSRIEEAKLLVDLDKGEYDCTAYFNAVDPETGAGLGKAGAQIVVVIES